MEQIRRLAWISVARGFSFGGLAVLTLMVGFSATPGLALDFGGVGFLLMTVILMIKANRSDRIPYKRTELWIMLEKHERPPPSIAPEIISRTRQDVILRFAHISALVAVCFLVMAAGVQLLGIG